jgi:histidinol-phosphatase
MTTLELNPDLWKAEYSGRLPALIEMVQAAGNITLQYYRTTRYHVERKADRSPVTEADREAEAYIRAAVTERFPVDSILGEEFGESGLPSEYRWIVDPIDGTKSFIAGVPLYSTLLGLQRNDEMIAGAILIPALDEIAVAAKGLGAWTRSGRAPWQRCQVSRCSEIADAVFVTSQVDSFDSHQAKHCFETLQKDCWLTRTWGDAYGYLLVATGRADVMVDPIVNPWDVGAIQPILEEAGGGFSDWRGNPTIFSKNAVGTNGRLHAKVLQRLAL